MKSKANITKRMLNDHKTWILSWGKKGKLADFNAWNLDNANFESKFDNVEYLRRNKEMVEDVEMSVYEALEAFKRYHY